MLRRLMKASFSTWNAKRLSETFIAAKRPQLFDPDKYIDANIREELEEKLKGFNKDIIPVIVMVEKIELDKNDNSKDVLKKEAFLTDFVVASFPQEEVKDVVAFFFSLEDKWINFISGSSASSEFDNDTLSRLKLNSIKSLSVGNYDQLMSDLVDLIMGSTDQWKSDSKSNSPFDSKVIFSKFLKVIFYFTLMMFISSIIVRIMMKSYAKELNNYFDRLTKLSQIRPIEQLMEENCNFCFERLQSEPQSPPEDTRFVDNSDLETANVLKCNHIYHRRCMRRHFHGQYVCPYCFRNLKTVDYPSLFKAYLAVTNLRFLIRDNFDIPQDFYVGPKVNTAVAFDPIESAQYFQP